MTTSDAARPRTEVRRLRAVDAFVQGLKSTTIIICVPQVTDGCARNVVSSYVKYIS